MSSHASCIGCSSRPTVAGRPSIVVMRSVGLICETGTEHGLNALPLMWLVHAWQTPRPQPYLGPVTPRTSRRTHSRRTSSSTSALTRLPLRMKVCRGIGQFPFFFAVVFFFFAAALRFLRGLFRPAFFRPSVGDWGIDGVVGNGSKSSASLWLIGNSVGILPVALRYAQATAAIVAATPNSPAPPGTS